MPVVRLLTAIAAPPERVFDLARSIDAHQQSAEGTHERAIAGVTHGLTRTKIANFKIAYWHEEIWDKIVPEIYHE